MGRGPIGAIAFTALLAGASAGHAQPPPVIPLPQTARPPSAPVSGTIYEMDTLTTGTLSPAVVKQIEPLHSLVAVEALLKENYVAFAWAHRRVLASSLAPALTAQLDALPPQEVFVVRQGEAVLIGVILSKR